MKSAYIPVALAIALVAAVIGYSAFVGVPAAPGGNFDATPRDVTLSGTYTCLPHADTSGPQTTECAFGFRTDDGDYYAVNFGAAGESMEQFRSGEHVTAEGNVVIKEALDSDHWAKYNMKGIFTVTKVLDPSAPASSATGSAKINIQAVCESALAYMTFPDSKSADAFVAECVAGGHPEVVEHYKAQMNFGDGAAI